MSKVKLFSGRRLPDRKPAKRRPNPVVAFDAVPWELAADGSKASGLRRMPSRAAVAAAVEAMINLLDAMDPDPDGDSEEGWDRELDLSDAEPSEDGEPSRQVPDGEWKSIVAWPS